MIRVGFIGLGGMGLHQARAFARAGGCIVSAGADVSGAACARFAAEFPAATVQTDHQVLLSEGKADAVVISVPTGLHARITSDALRARRPVLLEKPMARSVAECRRLCDLEGRTRTLLMVAHCRRYDPYWKSWAQAVNKGRIGFPVLWRHVAAGKGPGGWFMDEKLGGGPLLDGAVHNYDFANWIFGEPEVVLASSLKLVPASTAIDTGTAIVRYRSGDQLMLSWSWGTRGTNLHDIMGPKGSIQFGTGTAEVSTADHEKCSFCTLTNAAGKETLIRSRRAPDMYVLQARHFLDCIRGKATCLTPGREAIKAVAVAEAILKSAPGGKTRPVRW